MPLILSPDDTRYRASKSSQPDTHEFFLGPTRICVNCKSCTRYGVKCAAFQQMMRKLSKYASTDQTSEQTTLNKHCDCGIGDTGCVKCGLCRKCSTEQTCSQNTMSSRCAESQIQIGSKVFVQWREIGGIEYPGVVSGVSKPLSELETQSFSIQYDDGDIDKDVCRERIRLRFSDQFKRNSRARTVISNHINKTLDRRVYTNIQHARKELVSQIKHSKPTTDLNEMKQLKANSLPDMKRESVDESGHVGLMRCGCDHNLGTLSSVLNSTYYHVATKCLWTCCGLAWDSRSCSDASSSGVRTKNRQKSRGNLASVMNEDKLPLVQREGHLVYDSIITGCDVWDLVIGSNESQVPQDDVLPISIHELVESQLVHSATRFFPCDSWINSTAAGDLVSCMMGRYRVSRGTDSFVNHDTAHDSLKGETSDFSHHASVCNLTHYITDDRFTSSSFRPLLCCHEYDNIDKASDNVTEGLTDSQRVSSLSSLSETYSMCIDSIEESQMSRNSIAREESIHDLMSQAEILRAGEGIESHRLDVNDDKCQLDSAGIMTRQVDEHLLRILTYLYRGTENSQDVIFVL